MLRRAGGMRPLPLMEDVDLTRRLGRHRLVGLTAGAVTSAEKWERDGWYHRSARNACCVLSLWFLGVLGLPHRTALRMKDTVVVFARAPRLGTVKRRLARDIGARAALRFHVATLLGLLRCLQRERRFRTVLAMTPDGARDRLPVRVARIGTGATATSDSGMATACRRFPRGQRRHHRQRHFPDANDADLRDAAFRALGSHDAVFGPAEDGGYWLVALGPGAGPRNLLSMPGILQSTRWRTRCKTSAAVAWLC